MHQCSLGGKDYPRAQAIGKEVDMKQSVFKFQPIYKERPWGNGAISDVPNHAQAPHGKKIGESWELSDREGDESVIADGACAGKTIRWLLDEHGEKIMGIPWTRGQRFPLLIKLLDAAQRLSLQVHPPVSVASQLKGEPKTEIWYLLEAQAHAALMAGLKKGVTREQFETELKNQTLEPLIHRLKVKRGDAMFIPSGRIHAIDAGCLILEIQQNSDTTYRVYDWGHVGLDGKPRELHIEQTLLCTNFQDFEPSLVLPEVESQENEANQSSLLAHCDSFSVHHFRLKEAMGFGGKPAVLHMLRGSIQIDSGAQEHVHADEGETLLLGANPHMLTPAGQEQEFILAVCAT